MSEIKNVVIIGAGGNLGPSILKAFLDSSFNTTVLSREGSSSTFPAGVKVVRANYDSVDSLTAALKGQDAVVSLVGGNAIGDQNKIIDAAIAAGVKRFVPSEFGSNTTDPRTLAIVPVFKGKVAAVEYLKSKPEITWTSVVSGAFFDWGIKTGFLGFNASTKTASIIDGGKATFSTTNLQQIGKAVVKALENSSATKNQHVYINSFQTSQQDILAAVEKITGEKWSVQEFNSKDLIAKGGEKLKNQDFSGIVDLIQAVVAGSDNLGDHGAHLWNEKLGLEKEDFEESVKAGLTGKNYGEN